MFCLMNATKLTGLFVFTQTFRILIKLMQLYGITASCLCNFDGEMNIFVSLLLRHSPKVKVENNVSDERRQRWGITKNKTKVLISTCSIIPEHEAKKCMWPTPFVILICIWFLQTPVPILNEKKMWITAVQLSVSVFLWVEVLWKNCITLFCTRQNKANSSCWAHWKPNNQKCRLWRGFSNHKNKQQMTNWQTVKGEREHEEWSQKRSLWII